MSETVSEQIDFPAAARERIRNIGGQIEGLQAQLQQFLDGLILGSGVDVTLNDVSVNLENMTATVTPKK